MKGFTFKKVILSMVALSLAGSALPGALTPKQVQQFAQSAHRKVIVILRDQMPNLPPTRRDMAARTATLASAHKSVLAQLAPNPGRKVHSFSTINAFAATVTDAEAAQLAAQPMVQAVVNDAVIRPLPRRERAETSSSSKATHDNGGSNGADRLCNTLEPEALQLTHTAFLDESKPQAQQVRDGNGKLVTGLGVKVAYIADGIDPNALGFIRPDGSHVIIDYQDFTGDPAGTPTGGAEAFGDASSIAAQDMPNGKPLIFDIAQFVNEAHPIASPCNIRIRGMAPGASLVGLKVFSTLNPTTTSNFVQAIEYAVTVDDVDVINESFGGNPFPDNATDPISLANDAAVRAGVTVVTSTGDAGTAGTLGSPSTQPSVIAAGGSTQFRVYAQTGDGIMPLLKGGRIGDNISSLSSGGFSQLNARTVDVVAPGDLGWALCSTDQASFFNCSANNAAGSPTSIQAFGGTSESSPLTAGEAALVIQAYRSTHHGADPTPALVKRIIMSTATDLGAAAFEQGAGLINSLAAVNAALSVKDGNGRPTPRGDSVLIAPTSARITGMPDAHQVRAFAITNSGSTTQHLTPEFETLGEPVGATLTFALNPATDPTFVNAFGRTRAYTTQSFTVPAHAEHLDVAIAFQTQIGSTNPPLVIFALVDPSGRQAAYSIPQGLGSGYGHVDVVKPAGGTWKAVVWTRIPGVPGSYSGPIKLTWGAERYVKFGSVYPAHLTLAPGAHQSVTADFIMPDRPGDIAAAIRFDGNEDEAASSRPEIPVSLRTLIPTGPQGGHFTGTLTGGNARPSAGPTQTFAFDVPDAVNDMSLVLEISDKGYLLEGVLVDPNGVQLSVQPNQNPLDGSSQFGMQLSHYNPQPGRWKFVLLQNFISSGNQTSLPFHARIGFDTAKIMATGLPNDASVMLSATGAPVSVPIHITNTGANTQLYFADARLDTIDYAQFTNQPPCAGTTMLPGACGIYFVPTQANTVGFIAQSVVPITMDANNVVGTGVGGTFSPDIYAKPLAPNAVVALFNAPEVPYGPWASNPSLVGPYGPAGATSTSVSLLAYALLHPFDTAVSSDSGDQWSDLTYGTTTFNPLVLAPGQSGTIMLSVAPNPLLVGKAVTGAVFVDTFDLNVFSGDEVVRIPYSYTVAP